MLELQPSTDIRRPKFHRIFRGHCQVFIEQRGPDFWHGAVYDQRPYNDPGWWPRFKRPTEKGIKDDALITVENKYGRRVQDDGGDWYDESHTDEAKWNEILTKLGFPGYLK
jgi:hypothetical protein